MARTKTKEPILAQMFDRVEVKEYIKRYGGAIFSTEEVIKKDRIKDELILDIKSERMPDRIFFNGKEVYLKEIL